MSTYREYDSFTTEDGTKYVARYKKGRNIIEKIDPSGKVSTLSSSKGGTTSSNKARVAATFDSFKSGLEKAQAGEDLSYSEEDVTAGGGGGLFGGRDQYSTITLSDGTVLQSAAGKTADEVRTVKRLADEIGAVSAASVTEDTTEDTVTGKVDDETRLEGADEVVGRDVIEATQIDLGDTAEADAAESALAEVGQASAAAFGGSQVGDVTQGTESFTNVASIMSGGGMAGDAAGGQAEKEAAISVGPAEDEAVEMYTKGRRATISTGPRGLLTGEDEQEDPRFRRRRSLLAG
jgi:hypothetical protein